MAAEHYYWFFTALFAGLGLTLVGGVNCFLLQRSARVRLVATLLALTVTLGAASAIAVPNVVTGTVQLLALALLPVVLLSSNRVISGVVAILRKANQPQVRFGLVTVAGIGTAIASLVVSQLTDDARIQRESSQLAASVVEGHTPSINCKHTRACTDQGTPIVLKEASALRDIATHQVQEDNLLESSHMKNHVILRGSAGDHSNCHGWVFTGGMFRLSPDDVQLILKENGYVEVTNPQPGDLVVYRCNGTIAHSALVRYVTEGQPILVEGKWGALDVMLHPVDQSIYGSDFRFYRSGRAGHLLVGVGGRAPASDAGPIVMSE